MALFVYLCCPAVGTSGKLYKPLRHRVIREEGTIVNTKTVISENRKERAFLYQPSSNRVPAFIYLSTDFGRKLLFFHRCLITGFFPFLLLLLLDLLSYLIPDPLFFVLFFSRRSRTLNKILFLSTQLLLILSPHCENTTSEDL